MKLKTMAIFSLLSISSITVATKVKMPSAKILTSRLSKIGMDHFIEKTNLVSNLANRELESIGVAVAVETSLYDYNENLGQGLPAHMARMMQVQMQLNKPILLRSLLEDYPEALTDLQQQGLYKAD